MKRFLFFIGIVVCFFICVSTTNNKKQLRKVEAATNCSLASGSSQSTISTALSAAGGGTCTGTVNGNTVLLNAGSYNISSTVVIPCNANLMGPPITTYPFNQSPTQTATINGSTGANWGFQTTAGCTNYQTIEYLAWNGGQPSNGGGFLNIIQGSQNINIEYNWFHGVNSPQGNGQATASLIYLSGTGTTTTSNINILWNIFGTQNFSDCSTAMTESYSTNEVDFGAICAAVTYQNQVTNITINNNVMAWLEEPIKGMETQNSGFNCNNVVVDYNNVQHYSRIGYEVQCYIPGTATLTYTQYNNWGNRYGNMLSYDVSLANGCALGYSSGPGACENHTDYNVDINQTASPTVQSVGFEIWGQGYAGCTTHCTTASYNLFQGYLYDAITWATDGAFVFNNNTFNIVSANGNTQTCTRSSGGGGFFHVEDNPEFDATCVNNSFSNNVTGTYPSAAPSLSASGNTVTITNTGTNRDVNTTAWCTKDGTTPVVGGTYASSGNTALPYWAGATSSVAGTITISGTVTIKCVGMWGAPNQPYSYPSGFGYVPSGVVSATFSSGAGSTANPVFTPATEVFYPGPLSVAVSDSTSGAQIYCTNTAGTTGTTPTTSSPLYSGAFSVSATATIECMATSSGNSNSSVVSQTYTLGTQPVAATPVLSPTSESFSPGPLSVSVTDSTSGSTIYCTNGPAGSVPNTSSPVYTGAFSLSATATIECMATASGYSQSAVAVGTYTLTSSSLTYGVTTETGVAVSQPNYWVGTYVTTTGTLTGITGYIYLGSGGTIGDKFDFIVVPATGYNSEVNTASCYSTFTETTGTINGWQPIPLTGCTLAAGTYWIGYDTNDGGMQEGQNDCGGTTSAPTCPTGQANISSPNWGSWYAALAYGNYTFPTTYNGQQGAQTSLYMVGSPPGAAATPVFSPASESFSSTVTVSITDSTPGATITWCINTSPGCTPTTTYTGPETVPGPTFYAVATATAPGYSTSAAGTATYTYVAPPTLTSCALTAAGSATTLTVGGAGVQMTGQCSYNTASNVVTGTTTEDNVSSSTQGIYSANYFIVGSTAITPQTATIYIGSGTAGDKIDIGITQATSATTQSTNVLCYATITESGQTNQLVTVPITGCGTLSAGYTGFLWMNTNDPALTVGKQDCGGSCTGSSTSTTYGDCSSSVAYGTYTGIGTTFSSTCPGQYQRTQYLTSTSSAGGSTTLPCSAPPDANGGQITTWSTSASNIMAMGSFGGANPGLATGVVAGTANATAIATQGAVAINCAPYAFTVNAPAAPTLSAVTITLQSGGTNIVLGTNNNQACVNMTYTSPAENTQECGSGNDAYGNGAGTSWESLGTGIITSTTAGVLTGVAVGNATIEATVGSFHPTLNVGVTAVSSTAPTSIQGLTVKGLQIQ